MRKIMQGHGLIRGGARVTEAGIRKARTGELPWIVTVNNRTAGIHRTLEDAAQWLSEITGYPIGKIIADVERGVR